MNKRGAIVILNDLKKEREDVKKQYEEQKKKKFTDKHAMLYCIGFAGVFGATLNLVVLRLIIITLIKIKVLF